MYRTGNVTLMVADFERAVRFYVTALGLTLRTRHGDSWAEVEAPGLTIGIHAARPGGPQGILAQGLRIGLQVEDLDRAVTTLEDRGVTFTGLREDAGARFADLHDPDGTPLYLIQLRAH